MIHISILYGTWNILGSVNVHITNWYKLSALYTFSAIHSFSVWYEILGWWQLKMSLSICLTVGLLVPPSDTCLGGRQGEALSSWDGGCWCLWGLLPRKYWGGPKLGRCLQHLKQCSVLNGGFDCLWYVSLMRGRPVVSGWIGWLLATEPSEINTSGARERSSWPCSLFPGCLCGHAGQPGWPTKYWIGLDAGLWFQSMSCHPFWFQQGPWVTCVTQG